jgi:hypothetical protein
MHLHSFTSVYIHIHVYIHKKITGKGKAHSYARTFTHMHSHTQKRVIGKGNRFDVPAPQVAHTLMEIENQTRTAAIITRDQITLGQRIGEGVHSSVFEGTWADVHGLVRTCTYYSTRLYIALWGFTLVISMIMKI